MKKVFISYSHRDEELKKQLETHLSGLKRNGVIELLDDRQVLIGEKWDQRIKDMLLNSDVVLFLISADFLASEYINQVEIKETIERHNNKQVLIFPIFLRPCDFESSVLADFQGTPRDIKFLTSLQNLDSGFLEVTQELKRMISNFNQCEPDIKRETSTNNIELISCETPPDITKWVGREEELKILCSEHFKVIFITGIGGQGKSSLASKYLSDQANNFESWDWRDFKEEENRLKTKIVQIIQRYSQNKLSIKDLMDASFNELVELLFNTIEKKKVLFIFDNIDSYIDYETFSPLEGFKQLIEAALSRKHNSRFIFTCRPFIKRADVGFYQIELTGLKYENTLILLDKYNISIRSDKKEELYRRLHDITKGHPLWLNLLAAQAVSSIGKLEEFIENISKNTVFDEDNISKILSEKIIGAIWNSLNDKQKKLLRCLSELIKAESLEKLGEIICDELKYNQYTKALSRLKLLNLIVTKTKGDSEEIELHPLVKNFVKGKYPPSEQHKYISIIIDYYNKITYVLKKRMSGNESLNFYENWTNKVELAINKNDFSLALQTLEEISHSILTAGYFEEYYRIAKLLFSKINFQNAYSNEMPYFLSQLSLFVEISSSTNEFDSARTVLEKLRNVISSKGKEYVIYCKLECSFYWHKLDNYEAIKWGNNAINLIRNSKIDVDIDLEHTLNLAKRDSKDEKNLKESLIYFLKEKNIDEIIISEVDENLGAHYYGNLGRCYFFLKEYDISKKLYLNSFTLCYREEIASKYLNRGYISYWLGQLMVEKEDFKTAYFFFSNCIHYWKKYSPHRAIRVEEEMHQLIKKNHDIINISKFDDEMIENQCKMYVENQKNSGL